MRLTKNFTYDEFLVSRQFPEVLEQIKALLERRKDKQPMLLATTLYLLCKTVLQPVRDFIGTPIEITSGYRNVGLNGRVGGSSTSLHMQGIAADFTIPDLRVKQEKLMAAYNYIKDNLHAHYGQVILYEDEAGNFINVHVALPALGKPQFHQRRTVLKDGNTIVREVNG